jgi:hypothetical protein
VIKQTAANAIDTAPMTCVSPPTNINTLTAIANVQT